MRISTSVKIIIALFFLVFVANVVVLSIERGNVALIKISGIIDSQKVKGWIDDIKSVENDDGYKGVILEINSPGGGACASERLYMAVRRLSRVKPTVALIDSLGASGAYFVSCGADKIVAYPASVVGSIGVVFERLNVSALSKKLGVSAFVVKSGPLKDVGNPFRPPTRQDRKMLQEVVNSIYMVFLKAVSKSRHIPLDKLKPYANGSVFSGVSALRMGLVDSVDGRRGAINEIKALAHIRSVSIDVFKPRKTILERVMGERIYGLYERFYLLMGRFPEMLFGL